MKGQVRTQQPNAGPKPKARSDESLGAALLHECGRAFTRQLFEVWPTMMDKVDDALYDLADKASDSQSQAVFFDAMRHVRLKRTEMEETFRSALKAQVDSIKPDHVTPVDTSPDGGLSLVQTDELEESLAVSNMVEKVEKSCRKALFALDRRVAVTCGAASPEESTNPFGPRVICEAFRSACEVLELDIAIRLRVFKLFDRHVVSESTNIYATLNELFIKNGVLPEIPSEVRKSASSPRPGPASADGTDGVSQGVPVAGQDVSGAGVGAVGGPMVGGMPHAGMYATGMSGGVVPGASTAGGVPGVDMAMGVPGGGMTAGAAGAIPGSEAGGGYAAPAYATLAPGQTPQPEHVLEALYQIMTVKGAAAVQPAGAAVSSLFHSLGDLQLKEFVDLQTAQSAGAGTAVDLRGLREAQSLSDAEPIDQILIDVVAMMFEYILDDDSMPTEMKALISRLQIPMLKAAILDKSCFARMHHPARSLLNTLAEAALGWQSKFGKDEAFFARIEEFVRQVLTDFDDDIAVFATVLKSLRAFLDEEEEKAAYEAEQAARVMQRREQLAHARAATREALTSHLTQDGLPPFIHDFLSGHWRELLIAHYINDETGERFADAVTLTQELVWSLLPQPQLDWRKQLLKSLSGLVEALRAQLETFPLPGGEEQRFFDALSAFHLELIRGGQAPTPEASPTSADETSTAAAGTPPETAPETAAETTPETPAVQTGEVDLDLFVDTVEPGTRAEDTSDDAATDDDAADADEVTSAQAHDDTDATTGTANHDNGAALIAKLEQAIVLANQSVHAKAEAQPECHGMGTTVVAACYADQWLTMAHVGDSRLYRKRDARLEQMTRDHSLREDLVAKGFYTREEAVEKVPGNYVTRAVGGDVEIEVATDRLFALEGDVFVLCSDGLSDLIDDNDINAILDTEQDLESRARALVDAANEAGGLDNISVVLMRITSATTVDMAGLTDVGRKRSNNEDCFFTDAQACLGIVADGMGGANAGEVASAMTIAALTAAFGLGSAPADATDAVEPAGAGHTSADDADSAFAGINIAAIDSLLAGDETGDAQSGEAGTATSTPPPFEGLTNAAELQALAAEYGEVEEIIIDSNVSGMSTSAVKQTIVAQSYVDEFLQQAHGITVGTWVLFKKADGEKLRGRLSWKSEVSDKLLFTDRSGIKVADPTVHGFAIELRRGTASIIDDVPLFDRAMSSLTQRLRGNGAPAGA